MEDDFTQPHTIYSVNIYLVPIIQLERGETRSTETRNQAGDDSSHETG